MSGVYVVEVTVSDHDGLKAGVVARPWAVGGSVWRRVSVVAGSDVEALLVASQVASATEGMCTGARLVSWPTAPLD